MDDNDNTTPGEETQEEYDHSQTEQIQTDQDFHLQIGLPKLGTEPVMFNNQRERYFSEHSGSKGLSNSGRKKLHIMTREGNGPIEYIPEEHN